VAGPNRDSWIVLGSPLTPWSTIGTVNVAVDWPAAKSIIDLTGV
jgi:hypothetical protein